MRSVIEMLSEAPLFARLDRSALARLATDIRPRTVRAGEMIFREGEPCDGFYLVTAGAVRVFKLAPDGRERTLHIVRAPHALAEAALFGSGVFPAFADAMEASRLLMVPRNPFLKLLREEPDSALRVFESLSLWLHRLLDQLETETFLNARAKLASFLIREARRQATGNGAPTIRLAHTKKAIAAQLGMAPETFSRAQTDLETRGLIRVDGRSIQIPELEALQEAILADGQSPV